MEENLNRIVFSIIAPSKDYSKWILQWMHDIHNNLLEQGIIEPELVRSGQDFSGSTAKYLFNFVVKKDYLSLAEDASHKIQSLFVKTEKPSEDIILMIVCAKFAVEAKIGLLCTD